MSSYFRQMESGGRALYGPMEAPAGGTTQVSADQVATYDIHAWISVDQVTSYTVMARVSADQVATYTIATASGSAPGTIPDASTISASRTVVFGGGTNRVNFGGGTNRVNF